MKRKETYDIYLTKSNEKSTIIDPKTGIENKIEVKLIEKTKTDTKRIKNEYEEFVQLNLKSVNNLLSNDNITYKHIGLLIAMAVHIDFDTNICLKHGQKLDTTSKLLTRKDIITYLDSSKTTISNLFKDLIDVNAIVETKFKVLDLTEKKVIIINTSFLSKYTSKPKEITDLFKDLDRF